MGAYKIIHRLAVIGVAVFAAAWLLFIALMLNQPPLLRTAWEFAIGTGDGFHIVRLLIVITGALAFMLRGRTSASRYIFVMVLVVGPVGWVISDILHRAGGGENGRYWSYFAELTMFRWLLAPWFADYSFTLLIACLGLWVATLPKSRRQVLHPRETGI